ncbi:hypothetical protein ABZ281_00650 [Streptomyces sp. NPDC006265]|uniref:hypothetical protein n=1 Tax=Streptomyces sp. NPDC006265 TaxID=3156740 RepID=UPI0033A6B207
MAGTLLGLVSLAVAIYVAVQSVTAEPERDERSYRKGYHAFGDAQFVVSDEDRAVDEARCEELWGQFPAEELAGVNKDDWVAGCADYIEGK